MTAPLTPPHQPPHGSSDGPAPSPAGGADWPPPYPSAAYRDGAGRDEKADLAGEVRQGVLVAFAVTALGVLLGLLWLWLAPRVPLISDGKAVFLRDTEGEGAIGADAVFALLGLGLGALSAAGVFWYQRRGGIPVVAGLALGGLLGSLLGWGIGTLLGPTHDVAGHARELGAGVAFDAPLELKAYGAILAWPIAAMLVHLALTALFGPRDPEPDDWAGLPAPAPGATSPAPGQDPPASGTSGPTGLRDASDDRGH
ncbi:hypothetical protein [Streptomyces lichenis]|uniref:ABC transporter permease n=1 Tax=Streptomyces lichenis TaxID=2306967 RepID=A0ABT0IGK7_9ACTN|nr:hypothetical protein [Streptomyces lichenis]MCK8680467.1 hypothetical protein [Streptomyces lichenis]